ncbi:MAG: hypothetical protein WC421_02025 [Elusimicrobiales bacterium]
MKRVIAAAVYITDTALLAMLLVCIFTDWRLYTAPAALYYKLDCAHCAVVEGFLAQTPQAPKIVQAEVSRYPRNLISLERRAVACGLDAGDLRVPLLWDGTGCYVGDKDIINRINEKIAAKK